ncbi:hypothetical protein WISP_149176 [Willisornis vidua]|uniref:Uncharacterized protein n=1 Tax=Willisornis vidua TaxID=1566151 RepID=A0ABQ9CK81_9PASS|nr:hypothetical protein WISP_149176 [Willisornis vidua]
MPTEPGLISTLLKVQPFTHEEDGKASDVSEAYNLVIYNPKQGSSDITLLGVYVEKIPPLAEDAPQGYSSRLSERDLTTSINMGKDEKMTGAPFVNCYARDMGRSRGVIVSTPDSDHKVVSSRLSGDRTRQFNASLPSDPVRSRMLSRVSPG